MFNPGYTFLITWNSTHQSYGTVTHSFRTTDDAVEMWERDLSNEQEAGKIFNLCISAI